MLFFPVSPLLLGLYVSAALLPAILLMRYIYRQDTVEKEPMWLLMSLLFFGVLSAILAGLLEPAGEELLQLFIKKNHRAYPLLFAFLVVAPIEEGLKFFFLKQRTWNEPNFNYRFDGIVYSVFLSLGFAAYENIQYVLHYGLSVALPRALLAVPGHLVFAVIMGYFYGRAKVAEVRSFPSIRRVALWLSCLTAMVLHGFYDACAMWGSNSAVFLFVLFILLMYALVYHLVKRESASDQPLFPRK